MNSEVTNKKSATDSYLNSALEVEFKGFCKEGYECVVPAVFDPVCGSDMKTYTNKDAVDCYNADPDTSTGECSDSGNAREN